MALPIIPNSLFSNLRLDNFIGFPVAGQETKYPAGEMTTALSGSELSHPIAQPGFLPPLVLAVAFAGGAYSGTLFFTAGWDCR